MATNPLFHMEDQTDEDFFDKLVEDDFGSKDAGSSSATTMKFSDGNESDDARAFANLRIVDDSGGEEWLNEAKHANDLADAGAADPLDAKAEKETDPSSIPSRAVECDNSGAEVSSINALSGSEVEKVLVSDSAADGKSNGSGGFGVKEIGWGSLYVDSSENGGHGVGSFSDFFSELGDAGQIHGKVEGDVNGGGQIVSGFVDNETVGSDNLVSYGQYQEGQAYGNSTDRNTNSLDMDNSRDWENMYPGWKYDQNTMQWYQVDGQDASVNAQASCGNSASDWSGLSDGNSELAYLRQSAQSAVGQVAETATTESVSSWSQVSQVNNGYPEHMVFDPQYPGWYYDTIAQEWRTMESYNAAAPSAVEAQDQQIQNGYASTGAYTDDKMGSVHGEYGQTHIHTSQGFGYQSQHDSWNQSYSGYNQNGVNMWQPDAAARTESAVKPVILSSFGGNQQVDSFYGADAVGQQQSTVQTFGKTSQGNLEVNGISELKSFVPGINLSQQFNAVSDQQNGQMSFSNHFYDSQKSVNDAQQSLQSSQQFSYASSVGRSPDGRPAHAIVTFGFCGKLIVSRDCNSSVQNSSSGSQGTMGSSISVLNLAEVVTGNSKVPSFGGDTSGYFRALCQQTLPGPLVGGSTGSKDLNKWLDERIANCESPDLDYSKGKLLKLLLSLLKISCQHYGKLRSPFGADTTLKESDTPEAAVAKLFASAEKNGIYGALSQCLQHLPPEAQMMATASEVQTLLVSGRKMEALQCAQEGQLWGPAIIIATQLGDQFYIDTVKQMALRQLVAGSPLRTLCLLIAGQPAEVFSAGNASDCGLPGSMNTYELQSQLQGTNSMLDDWEENLAIITANRTKDDELVITHLGDCLWKERSEIIAAHICYLVADKNFEPYSDTARMCLVGADHWKFPRTYASPEAIQRTELYEYSKVLGNSQYILLPFQPYKLIYAHMLAEIGKVSDALKYCQAVLKSLKTGRAPEVETWKQLVLSLEERIRLHQQGGYSVNLAPAKLVGKLLNFFDNTAHRVVGGLPPPAPASSLGNVQVNEYRHQQAAAPRVSTSQSTLAMSSLMPSASMEPIHEWTGDRSRMTMQNRSVSEPNFDIRARQDHQVDSSKEKTIDGAQQKASDSGTASRFGRFGFGSQLLKKTVGLVLRPKSSREAKLGETNKFYYDEKLKRWVEEGVEAPAEEAALAPPPTTAAFLGNNLSDHGNKSEMKSEMSPSGWSPNFSSPTPSDNASGIPPIPSNSNQFSSRGRMGVRARYVDTFNQGRGNSANAFQSPSVPSVKPAISANAKFFIPTPVTPTNQEGLDSVAGIAQEENPASENASVPATSQQFQTPTSSSPSMNMQRFPSMDNIKRAGSATNVNAPLPPSRSRRTASWSGSFNAAYSPPERSEGKPLNEASSRMSPSTFTPSPLNSSSSFGDDLHEVEL